MHLATTDLMSQCAHTHAHAHADDTPMDVPSEVVRKSLMLPATLAQHVGRLVMTRSTDSTRTYATSHQLRPVLAHLFHARSSDDG